MRESVPANHMVEEVSLERSLVTLAYNFKRLFITKAQLRTA
jgi:hypothetical protein